MKFLLTSAVYLGSVVAACAIVNVFNPQGNTTAPTGADGQPDDPGFAYVGQVNGSTGVYLGNGWVLTADHVGAGTFNLGGTNYGFNGTDSHQIGGVDLRLFRLSSDPGLPLLTIASTPNLLPISEVVQIGAGRTPDLLPTTWFVDTTDPADWIWSETTFPDADTTHIGYKTSSTKAVRWGTNTLSGYGLISYSSYAPSPAYETTFDSVGTTYESQAVTNDSGSALFIETISGWQLAGLTVTVGLFNNQPNGAQTAIFGNTTASLDLAPHLAEINGYVIPEPGTYALLIGIAVLGLVTYRRRR
ncbi:MAG: PEP-CTERM sorting domain-containing protein [Puniceicoccales bacterium]